MMAAGEILRKVMETGETLLLEDEAKGVLESSGIATAKCLRVTSPEEAAREAEKMSFPVVLKVCSRKISHKSDIGGVALNLASQEEVARAYERLLAAGRRHDPEAGLVLQKMAGPGRELIVGVTVDIHFGPVIMLGMGGIFTEILDDTTCRLLPITPDDARDMAASLRGYPVLSGARGQAPADLEAVQDLLARVSGLVSEHPEIREMDLNPVVVYPKGCLVLDARMVLQPAKKQGGNGKI